jgi:hypothetical protein
MIVAMLAAGLVLAACGQSQQDKAKSQVCDARADIKKQVDQLKGLTVSTASVDGVKSSLKTIQTDLGKMKDAQGDLNADRKKQVTAANQAFASQLSSIVKNVGSSLSLTEAATQVKSALAQLTSTYQQTLGRIDCS